MRLKFTIITVKPVYNELGYNEVRIWARQDAVQNALYTITTYFSIFQVLLVCNRKQHLGYLEDSIHNVRRKLRSKNMLTPPNFSKNQSSEPNTSESYQAVNYHEEPEDTHTGLSNTSRLLESTLKYINMKEEISI